MKTSIKLLNVIFLFFTTYLHSQTIISGKVIDGDFNDPLPFANISLRSGNDNSNLGGTTTDFDGNFYFEVEEGTYSLEFTYVGYSTQIINDIKVSNNQEEVIHDVIVSATD